MAGNWPSMTPVDASGNAIGFSGGLSAYHLKAAATTNLTAVKASPGRVHSIHAYNASAAVKYLKLYDKATAPLLASDVPVMVLPLAVGANHALDAAAVGVTFVAGIAIAITGALANTDTTALAANDVILNMVYS